MTRRPGPAVLLIGIVLTVVGCVWLYRTLRDDRSVDEGMAAAVTLLAGIVCCAASTPL